MRPNTPLMPTQVTVFYPVLSVYGMSAQGNALGGVMSLEVGDFQSRDDEDGDDPAIPNSQIRFLLSDSLSATLGANIFGGEKARTFFGQFDKNDNVCVAVRFDF